MSEKYLGENSTPILINQIKDKLEENYKVMGELGAKNLLVYPFYEATKKINGITFTVNTDNSVNIDGTSTNYAVFFYERTLEVYNKGQYILSVVEDLPSGVIVQFGYYTDNTFTEKGQINNTHKSILVEVTDEFDTHPISIRITVNPNITVNNLIVHSMLRYASDTDSTWQPYIPTNKELDNNVNDIWTTQGKLGSKNLLTYPYRDGSSKESYDILFTANNDTSVTVNGTATNWATFYIQQNILPMGEYILSINNEIIQGVYLQIGKVESGTYTIISTLTYGTLEYKLVLEQDTEIRITIQVKPNTVVDNITLYPMLRYATDINNTWQPCAPTNRELFLNKMDNVNPTGTGALSLNRRPNTTVGSNSIATGNNVVATAGYSASFGNNSEARGTASISAGNFTTTGYTAQAAMGQYNDNKSTTLFEVGNGADANNRSNAFEVYSDGSLSTDNGTTKVKLEDVVNNINDIWKVNGELGAKNLISLPFYNGTDTRNGVLWTDNGDSTLSFYGQIETGYTYSGYNIMRINTLKANTYILSMAKPFPTAYLEARLINNVGSMIKSYGKATPNNGGTLTFEITTEDEQHIINDNYRIGIIAMIDSSVLPSGDTADGVIYPMLRLASDLDDTWMPYVPTNKELADDTTIIDISDSFYSKLSEGISLSDVAVYKQGKHIFGSFAIDGLTPSTTSITMIVTYVPLKETTGYYFTNNAVASMKINANSGRVWMAALSGTTGRVHLDYVC